jgi:dihydrofolate reductase
MRKLIADMMMSLDGYFEGPNRDIDWFVWDKDMERYSVDQLKEVDAILLGRVAYELFAKYWPTPAAVAQNPAITSAMNALPKIVFSRTLKKVSWNNSRLVKERVAEEISKLKSQAGKNMVMYGGAGLLASLSRLGLIDEFRFRVNPIILGSGRPLFQDVRARLNLKLLKTETLGSGVVTLFYRPG